MRKDKWIFYTDLFGSQRWERLDTDGLTIAESSAGFPNLDQALSDATLNGYLLVNQAEVRGFELHCRAISADEDMPSTMFVDQ